MWDGDFKTLHAGYFACLCRLQVLVKFIFSETFRNLLKSLSNNFDKCQALSGSKVVLFPIIFS